jgi:hypothetical protein
MVKLLPKKGRYIVLWILPTLISLQLLVKQGLIIINWKTCYPAYRIGEFKWGRNNKVEVGWNFLQLHCIEALEHFLRGYEGTVIIVSHDQIFIERVADYVYVIDENQLTLIHS